MDFKNIDLNQRNQKKSGNILSFHLYEMQEKEKFIYIDRKCLIPHKGWGWWQGLIAKLDNELFRGNRNALSSFCFQLHR